MTKSEQINILIRSLGIAQRAAADAWVQGSGLTRQQSIALGLIEDRQENGVIARDLAQATGTTAAAVASLLQGLEDRGLITRTPSPEDSRVKLLRVTEEGARVIDGFDAEMRSAQEAAYSALTEEEKSQLIDLLTRIAQTQGAAILTPPARPFRH